MSDMRGGLQAHSHLEGMGMEAGHYFRLREADLIALPPVSRLFMLPGRHPVGYEPLTKSVVALDDYYAVAAFTPPGYTVTHNSAYKETAAPKPLPLFSYAAVVLHKGAPHAAAVRVDSDRRHDSRFIDIARVTKNAKSFKKIFARNRLIPHLERCALIFGCPNAQNFFLSRYEAPLPASPSCNGACAGCISNPPAKGIYATQPRIKFIPTPEELSEIALFHISRVRSPIVSFGQGCEGEPLLAGDAIEKAILLIREKTSRGTININTNGSRPNVLERLFDAGLDSVRVSMNSPREIYYTRYYKPRGYGIEDVYQSMKIARKKKKFVSINLLTMPGFTDSKDEVDALKRLIRICEIDMIQWRNLNFDPMLYFKILKVRPPAADLIGIRKEMRSLQREFPRLRMGYFNPFTPRAAASPRR